MPDPRTFGFLTAKEQIVILKTKVLKLYHLSHLPAPNPLPISYSVHLFFAKYSLDLVEKSVHDK